MDFPSFRQQCEEVGVRLAIVLGSGMATVAERIKAKAAIPFGSIPGLVGSSVHGHRGQLTLGLWGGQPLLLFEGRLHFYEGNPWEVVTRPVRLAADLGATTLILTNASGGIREDLGPGTMMLQRQHLECNHPLWWRSRLATTSPYDPGLRQEVRRAGKSAGVELAEGTYASVTGPCYETPAEIRALRAWGADAVGMSTTREALAGAEAGMQVAAISCVANRAAGLGTGALTHQEVLDTIAGLAGQLADLLEAFVLGNH